MKPRSVAVLPAYACAATVAEVVAGVAPAVDRVIVVDDGSRDGTGDRARAAGAEVIRRERNGGKGAALRAGIERALALDPLLVALLDADGQHDPRELPRLLAACEPGEADLVIGARLGDAAAIPPLRYWTNAIGTKILSRMTGYDLEDSQSGYRVLTAQLLRELSLRSSGYAIESEMLIKAAARGARIAHVPVRAIYEGGPSYFRPLRDTVRISWWSIYFKVFETP